MDTKDSSIANGIQSNSVQNTSDFLVGDLLWSRVPGYPFWPCMVSYDPLLGTYVKMQTLSKSSFAVYHVQYFGEVAQHGWTKPNNTIVFEGRKKFEAYVESVKEAVKTKNLQYRQKTLSKYSVTDAQRKKWECAVQEAEMALQMSRNERIENFTFIYTMPKRKNEIQDSGGKMKKLQTLKDKQLDVCDANYSNTHNGTPTEKKNSTHRNEYVCQICSQPGANISCSGLCLQSFHSNCVGLLVPPEKFLCNECSSGKHCCFHCKKMDAKTKKCAISTCGKFYHHECLQEYPIADKDKFICPLHFCISCYNDNSKSNCVYKSRTVKCFRCPTAYHAKDICVAAGCELLSSQTVLCPSHFDPKKKHKNSYNTSINISWCFICGQVGELICCETCPAAFHLSCLEIDPPDNGEKYFCSECVSKNHVRCGEVVWVKLGSFRWWPACVKNTKDVPPNILNMEHYVGEFPIQYFGTHEYYWTHKGRVFRYTDDDKDSLRDDLKPHYSKKSSLEKKYKQSLDEASVAHEKFCEEKAKLQCMIEKPPPFKLIKSNKPVGKVQIHTDDVRSFAKCICDPETEHPCGYSSNCINRSMLVECHPNVCRAGNSCENQQFQRREHAKVKPFRTPDRGWALKTEDNIKAGHFVIEYVGDLIDAEECKRRLSEKHKNDDTNYYFLTLDKDRIIDAGPKGNLSRFMNHSCEPNCETQKWLVNGDTRIGLFSKCDIAAGTELTFDYMLDSLDNEKLKCLCGAQNCRGKIGEKPSSQTRSEHKQVKAIKKKKKRKQIAQTKVKEENVCYLCKEPGTLIMCDRKGCPKAYHIACLDRDDVPSGQWQCPWHFCDMCGHVSKYLCSLCPNSFCEKHKTVAVATSVPDKYICPEHSEKYTDSDTSMDTDMCNGY